MINDDTIEEHWSWRFTTMLKAALSTSVLCSLSSCAVLCRSWSRTAPYSSRARSSCSSYCACWRQYSSCASSSCLLAARCSCSSASRPLSSARSWSSSCSSSRSSLSSWASSLFCLCRESQELKLLLRVPQN